MYDIEGNLHGCRYDLIYSLPVSGLFLHTFVQLVADVGFEQQSMELGEAALCEKGSSQANGLWVAIEELEKGMLADLCDFFAI